MALKAGRVGVARSEVDEFGHITGGGTPENVYTKTQCDNKFETKTHVSNTYETKENIGGLKFRDNDGTAQYQLPNGEWTNFSSGGELWNEIWSNSSPTSSAGFDVTDLDLSQYTELMIECVYDSSSSISYGIVLDLSGLTQSNNIGIMCTASWGFGNDISGCRQAKISMNKIHFYDGNLFVGGNYNRADNAFCLPVSIKAR